MARFEGRDEDRIHTSSCALSFLQSRKNRVGRNLSDTTEAEPSKQEGLNLYLLYLSELKQRKQILWMKFFV